MRLSIRSSVFGAAALLAGIAGLEATITDAAEAVPDAEFKAIVEQDAKNIATWAEIGQKAVDAKQREKISHAQLAVKSNAMNIAAVAQSRITGKNPALDGPMIALRDTALTVAKLAGAKKFNTALAVGKALSTNLPGAKGGNAAMSPGNLAKAAGLDVQEVMYQFNKTNKGGLEIEVDIKANGKTPAMKPDAVAGVARRALAVVDYCNELMPRNGFSKSASKEDWDADNKKMKEAAIELLVGAKANDKKAMQTAFTKLDGACVSCHTKFKK